MIRLRALFPEFYRLGDQEHHHEPDLIGDAFAIEFNCPGCCDTPHSHRIFAPFQGRYTGGGPKWAVMGSSFDDLTFYDTAEGSRSIRVLSGCRSHFNLVCGNIEFYCDSGHLNYRPESTMPIPVNDTPAQAVQTAEDAGGPDLPYSGPLSLVVYEQPLDGFNITPVLQYYSGMLVQRYDNPHNTQPQQIWVRVPGTPTPPGLLHYVDQMIEQKMAAAGVGGRTYPLNPYAAHEEAMRKAQAAQAQEDPDKSLADSPGSSAPAVDVSG